jgi:hypothetical protein
MFTDNPVAHPEGHIEFGGTIQLDGKTVRFLSGEVRTTKDAKEATFSNGTKAQIDDVTYVHGNGKWQKERIK